MNIEISEIPDHNLQAVPVLSGQDQIGTKAPSDFSTRVENFDDGVISDNVNGKKSESELQDTKAQQYDSAFELLREASKLLHEQESKSEMAAHSCLIQIALVVHMPDFDLNDFGKRAHRKPSKANYRNQYFFVLTCVDDTRDKQVASNQCLALRYAVNRVQREGRPIESCFDDISIRECLRLSRAESVNERSKTSVPKREPEENSDELSEEKPIYIHGIPPELLDCGRILLEVDISGGSVRYIRTIEGG
jgi:hypothetical protein